jgi:methylglyoxal reductase
VEAIRTAIDQGINLIDTAPAYGMGHSEVLVGQAIQGRRNEVIVATKCGLSWDTSEGSYFLTRDGKRFHRDLSRKAIKAGAEQSLRNLGIDTIDLFITHWQASEPVMTPVSETMDALLELKREGKIRAIGISNVTPDHVRDYLQYGQVDLIQQRYSMLNRQDAETHLLPLCEQHKISLQAYMPLEQGLLSGRMTMDTVLGEYDVRNKNPWYRPENRVQVVELLESWRPLCDKYACEISHLAIAWVIARSEQNNALCGGRKNSHVIENARAGSIILEPADVDQLTSDLARLKLVTA